MVKYIFSDSSLILDKFDNISEINKCIKHDFIRIGIILQNTSKHNMRHMKSFDHLHHNPNMLDRIISFTI